MLDPRGVLTLGAAAGTLVPFVAGRFVGAENPDYAFLLAPFVFAVAIWDDVPLGAAGAPVSGERLARLHAVGCRVSVTLGPGMMRPVVALALLAVAAGLARANSPKKPVAIPVTTVVVGAPGTAPERVVKAERAFADLGRWVVERKPDASASVKLKADAVQRLANAITAAGDAYLNERYDDAIRDLEAVEELDLVLLLPTPAGRALLVQSNLWLGALHGAAGEDDMAERRFRLALSLDPEAALDSAVWPPSLVRKFEQTRAVAPAKGRAVVNVDPQAKVELDGRPVEDPTALTPTIGTHYLYVHRFGFGRWANRISVEVAEVTAVSKQVGDAKPEELAEDAAKAMEHHYAEQPKLAVRVIASASGADQVAVVAPTEVFLYDHSGVLVSSATGADIAAAVRALGPTHGPTHPPQNGKRSAPIYKKWWFWAAAGAVAIAGGVGIYSLTSDDNDELRGRFVRPAVLSFPLP